MPDSESHLPAPGLRRFSLVMETARSVREGIENGLWSEFLPGERTLCDRWQISRPTLRAALQALQQEGLIAVSHGHRTRVLVPVSNKGLKSLTIGLLSPEPLELMPPSVLLWVDELRRQLATSGHILHVQVGRACFLTAQPEHAIESLISGTHAAVWILYQSTEAMQRWFEESRVPCVVVGTLFPGITLPAVDKDYRATCRHAVGLLTGRGHRNVALLIQKQRYGGDMESERGFLEGVEAAKGRGVAGHIVRHDGSIEKIQSCLVDLLSLRVRPTALIVARSSHALTALTVLLQQRVRIPVDMALLCRDDDTFLDQVIPRMSRYSVSPSGFVKRIFRRVMHRVQGGHLVDGEDQVVPSFVSRESH